MQDDDISGCGRKVGNAGVDTSCFVELCFEFGSKCLALSQNVMLALKAPEKDFIIACAKDTEETL